MGIRVKKVLGYGLTGCGSKDKRINWNAYEKYEYLSDAQVKSLVDFAKRKTEEQKDAFRCSTFDFLKEHQISRRLFHYNFEGSENVFCVSDGNSENVRSDETMDYIEAELTNDYNNHVNILKNGYYPFENQWMMEDTGENIPGLRLFLDRFIFTGDCKLTGLSQTEIMKLVAPIIPDGVRDICEFTGIFKDNKTILSLRPMLYVYWC